MTDKARLELADALAELGWNQDAQAIRDEVDSPRVDAEIEVINAALRPAPAIDLRDISLAAQMLTWGREDGLDDQQIEQIDAHAEKLFSLIDGKQASGNNNLGHVDDINVVELTAAQR